MNGKVIAVANMKGGVGKTATVVGIAEALAASGKSVLVIDLDAQANASICIAGDAVLSDLMRNHCTIDGFINEFIRKGWSANFDSFIKSDVSNVTHRHKPLKLSLLASSPALRDLERDIVFALTKRKKTLGDVVEALWDLMQEQFRLSKQEFDVVIIDCAPGISVLTEVSIRLADLIVIPTIPDFLSTSGSMLSAPTCGTASSPAAPPPPRAACPTCWQPAAARSTSTRTPSRRSGWRLGHQALVQDVQGCRARSRRGCRGARQP